MTSSSGVHLPLSRFQKEVPWVSRTTLKKWVDEGIVPEEFVVIDPKPMRPRVYVSTRAIEYLNKVIRPKYQVGALLKNKE